MSTGSAAPFPPSGPVPAVLLSQAGFRRREESRFRPCCLHVLSRPPPPAQHKGSQACSSSRLRQPASQPADLSSQRSLSPPRGRLAPLPLPEPGALEARPGQAWRLRPRGAHRPESCPSPWAQEAAATTAPDIQASHLTPRPPPIWSAGRLAAMRLPWAASLCSLAWGPLILGLCDLLAAFQPQLVREGLCRWVGAGR